jgi:hypothetical protein
MREALPRVSGIIYMAYSIDFREAAIKFKESWHSFSELKEVFGIVPQTYYNLINYIAGERRNFCIGACMLL